MATSKNYIEFVCEQIRGGYSVRYKKMFGEYIVYVNDKPVLLVCDNTVYVKALPELNELFNDAGRGIPYSGAKEHYVLDVENEALVNEAISVLVELTPVPKKKKR